MKRIGNSSFRASRRFSASYAKAAAAFSCGDVAGRASLPIQRPRKSCALTATTIVDRLMAMASTLMGSSKPQAEKLRRPNGGGVSEVAEGNWNNRYPGTGQANYPFDPTSPDGCGPYDCNLICAFNPSESSSSPCLYQPLCLPWLSSCRQQVRFVATRATALQKRTLIAN